MTTNIIPFNFHGEQVRTLTDEHGEPWFVLVDLLDRLSISRRPSAVVERLDGDGVRQAYLTDSLGRDQKMHIVDEPTMYEVIVRSDSPQAKPFRRWVTGEVLPAIRKTGGYSNNALTGPALMAAALIEAQQTLADHQERISELEPPAKAWTALASSIGDWSLRDAAQILARDPFINTGQNRLARYLRQVRWIDDRGIPYQTQIDLGRLAARARTYENPRTGERETADPQVRITAKGLTALHKALGGIEPLAIEQDLERSRTDG